MKKVLYILFTATILLVSCTSKDQKVVNQLEGEWQITSMTVDGTAVSADECENTTYKFDKCKVKDEDCNGKIIDNDPVKGIIETDFTYSVSNDGETISMTFEFFGITDTQSSMITESSKSKMVFEFTDDDGEVTITSLSKI